MVFEIIRKSSAPEMVVEQILEKIEKGELEPGGQLPSQRELAQLFGVGRSSVREATNALVVMGYLEVTQGRGTFIRKDLPGTGPSTDRLQNALAAGNIFDLMEAREPLECKSCRLAAERAEEPRIKAMEAALQKARAAADDDYPAFLDADLQFHYALAEATHNAVICEMMKLLIEKVLAHHSRLRTRYLSANFRAFSIDTAARVIDCVRVGDGDGAAGWMRQHLNAINPELKTLIPNGRDGNSSDR
ncbi:MAG: FadR/GntR family transcriptional regulator [Desulfobacterales bacterium]|jgi:GntR family transcriptional repressor for pyruvate dehydrogenase complex|nr:FadR/GntR family transcriptional regulator [Desulfobacterales bacterium]